MRVGLRINRRMSQLASVMKGVTYMFRKLTVALVAVAALGTATLASSAAEAHWYGGYGWKPHYGYSYGHSYWKPNYGYGYGHYGYKPRFYGYPRYFHRYGGWKRFGRY
jgi:hypothetical protein